MRYHVKKLPLNCSYYPSSVRIWSMDSCLRCSALSQVYLSLTFKFSQTAAVKVEMSSTFPDRFGQVKQFMSRKGVSNCFAICFLFRFAIQLETRLETAFNGYTCLSILLATSNYRARGTCSPSTPNYLLNGAANA